MKNGIASCPIQTRATTDGSGVLVRCCEKSIVVGKAGRRVRQRAGDPLHERIAHARDDRKEHRREHGRPGEVERGRAVRRRVVVLVADRAGGLHVAQ